MCLMPLCHHLNFNVVFLHNLVLLPHVLCCLLRSPVRWTRPLSLLSLFLSVMVENAAHANYHLVLETLSKPRHDVRLIG